MSDSATSDPIDDLRRANPVSADELPSASLARVSARVQEATRRDIPQTRSWRRFPGAALGSGVAVALIAVLLVLNGGSFQAPVTPSPSEPSVAFCVEEYGPGSLRRRSVAFDGTVAAIKEDDVTFTISRSFRGPDGGTVTLAAPGMTGGIVTSAGGPSFEIGQRYLVAGEDRFAWACGFSQPYDPDIAAEWARIFGS